MSPQEQDQPNPLLQRQFIGIDNMNPDSAMQPGFVRDAENVLMRRDGTRPARRDGRALIYEGTRVHSGWGDGLFPYLLFVDDGELLGLQALDDAPVPLAAGLGDAPVSYARANDLVYWSNGQRAGLITMHGEVYPWACPASPGQPTLAANPTVGGLNAGAYQVAVTWCDALGREGGTPGAAIVDLPQGGGIELSSIPQPADPSVTRIRIYRTYANDAVLRHARYLPVGTTSVILGAGDLGAPLKTQFHEPLPAGHLIGFGHARVWSMRDNVLFVGEALRSAQGVLPTSYIRFGDRGAVLAPVGDGTEGAGVYVAAGKRTFWLGGGAGNPAEFRQTIAYKAGAVPGTLAWSSGDVWGLETKLPVPSWLATDGQFCVGLPGGQVQTFNANTVSTETGESGASMVRERGGIRSMVTTLRGPSATLGLGERMTVTVRRNGIEV